MEKWVKCVKKGEWTCDRKTEKHTENNKKKRETDKALEKWVKCLKED